MKNYNKFFLVLSIASLMGITLFLQLTKPNQTTFSQGEISFYNQNLTIKTDIAMTTSQRELGLMFMDKLALNQGLLLIFTKEEITKVWMKNMRFPLDIIFISSSNHVVSLLKNIPPCLNIPCPIYESIAPSITVLELNAGKIDQFKIKIGDKVAISVY